MRFALVDLLYDALQGASEAILKRKGRNLARSARWWNDDCKAAVEAIKHATTDDERSEAAATNRGGGGGGPTKNSNVPNLEVFRLVDNDVTNGRADRRVGSLRLGRSYSQTLSAHSKVTCGSLPVHDPVGVVQVGAACQCELALFTPRLHPRIHLVQQVCGLDVNPTTIALFERMGDAESVNALNIIHARRGDARGDSPIVRSKRTRVVAVVH